MDVKKWHCEVEILLNKIKHNKALFRHNSDDETDAVLFHLLKGQLPAAYYANKVEKSCIDEDIPFICVETDYTKADKEQVKIRIEAFTELLKVKNKSDKRRRTNEKLA